MWGTEQIWLVAMGGFLAFLANVMYMMGGTEGFGKWWRRFIGSCLLALSATLVAIMLAKWSWQYILMWPCLIGGFSLGYGGKTTIEKVLKRSVFALGVLTACICGAWAVGFTISAWVVVGLALVTGLTSVVLGVFNPFSNAPLEQFIISQVLTLYVPFWAFVNATVR
jgi:hypothetical protein